MPIIMLADVERNSNLVRTTPFIIRNVDWSNHYSLNWSPFSPLQIEAKENGVIPNETWKDGSGEYSPCISSRV